MRTIKTNLAALLNTGIRGTLAALLLTASAALLTTSCANTLGDDIPASGTDTAAKSLTFTIPSTLDGFNENGAQTRAVAGFDKGDHKWQTGDKILAEIYISDDADKQYHIYTTLTCSAAATTTGGTATWTVDASDKVLIKHTTDGGSTNTVNANSGDNALLTTAAGTVTLTMPKELAALTDVYMEISLYYAPALQWANNTAEQPDVIKIRTAESPCQATTQCWIASKYTTTTFAPADLSTVLKELTDFSKTSGGYTYNKFAPESSRLRVYMGADKAGEIVTLVAGNIFMGAAERYLSTAGTGPTGAYPLNYTYTATVDATGNAYFYGYTDEAMDGTTDAGTDKRFTVSVFDTEVFAASTTNPVTLGTDGKSYAIDASWVDPDPTYTKCTYAAFYAAMNSGTNAALKAKLDASNNWRIDMAGYTETDDATNVGNVVGKINAHTAGAVNLKLTNLTKIANYAFQGCTNLATISLPKATTINYQAFKGCTKLTTINMPAATSINSNVFYLCYNLTTVSLPAAVKIGGSTFESCTNLTTITLPAATSIDNFAFKNCIKLATVNLPAATYIYDYAFNSCPITTLKLTAEGNITLSAGAFYGFYNAGSCALYLNPDKKSGGSGTPTASGICWGYSGYLQYWKSITYENP